MALAAFNGQVQDLEGNALANVFIEVRRAIPGQPLARIYADRDGTVPLGNPFALNPLNKGHFRFHVEGGAYRVRAYDGQGFEKVWDYVAVGTAQEFDVRTDEDRPLLISQNVDAGYALIFEPQTNAPPGPGGIRFNHTDLSQATEAYISSVNAAGSDISSRLLELFDPLRSRKDSIILTNAFSNKQASFRVDGVMPDGSPPTYFTLAISQHSGETTFPAEAINLQREQAGVDGGGIQGPSGGVQDGEAAVFDGTTGQVVRGAGSPPLLKTQNLSDLANPVEARKNLKIEDLTQEEFDDLDPPDPDTIYLITDG